MNVLYVTGQLWDADFIDHELRKIAPHIQLDVSPRHDDALARLGVPGRYDVVLLDSAFSGEEAPSLVARIREQAQSSAVVVLIPPTGEDPPLRLLEAGADDYLIKRPHFVKQLPVLLQRAVERRRVDAERRVRPFQVLYVGDRAGARHYFSSASLMDVEVAVFGSEESVLPPAASGKLGHDAVVVDDSVPAPRMFRVLKEVAARSADTPVILLVEPEQDSLASQALKMGAAECVVKSGDFIPHLIASVENAIRRRDLVREKTTLRFSEAHFRLLVENIPACVTLLTCQGAFQAMNWAGLSLVGATRVDQLVGKNLCTLVGPKHESRVRSFLASVCAGSKGILEFEWDGLDGIARRLELNSVALRRESDGAVSVLSVMRELPGVPAQETMGVAPGADSPAPGAEHASAPDVSVSQGEPPSEPKDDTPPAPEMNPDGVESQVSDPESSRAQGRESEDQTTVFEESLRIARAAYAQLEEEHRICRLQWQEERQRFDDEKAALQAATQEATSRVAQREAESSLKQDAAESETPEVILRARLEEDVRRLTHDHEQLELTTREEKEQSEQARREGERRLEEAAELRASLEDQVRGVTQNLAELDMRAREEKGEWEQVREEMERRLAEAEIQRVALEERCRHFTENQAEFEVRSGKEKAEWDQARHTLELKLEESATQHVAAAEQLRRITHDHEQLDMRAREEKEPSEQARWEGERRLEEATEQRASLQDQIRRLTQNLAELEMRARGEKEEGERVREEMEQRLAEAERRRDQILDEERKHAENRSDLEVQIRAEKETWHAMRRQWEERQGEWAEQHAGLGAALGELQLSQSQMTQKYRVERAEWDSERLALQHRLAEFESRRAEGEGRSFHLIERLRELEAGCAAMEDKYRAEKDACEKAVRELEQQRQEQRAGIAAFEDALRVAEARVALVHKQRQADQTGWVAARAQWQHRFEALEQELAALQARHEESAEQARIDKENWEKVRKELMRSQEAAETMHAAMAKDYQAALVRLSELDELRLNDASARQKERLELDRQAREMNAKIRTLDQALAAATAVQEKLLNQQQRDAALREEMQANLDNQRAARVALEDALQISEVRRSDLRKKLDAERIGMQEGQEELERLRNAHRAIEEALRHSESRLTKLAEEQTEESVDLDALRRELESQRIVRVVLGRALKASELHQGIGSSADVSSPLPPTAHSQADGMTEKEARILKNLEENDPGRPRAACPAELAHHAAKPASGTIDSPILPDGCDVNKLITQETSSWQRTLGESVELLVFCSPDLPRVLVSRAAADKLLTGLAGIAVQALPFGGTITVETRRKSPGESLDIEPAVILSMSLSGCSVWTPADTSSLEHVVTECRGKIRATGDPDTGITFEVLLPSEPLS